MCWRDPRLAHGLDAAIIITEETFLKKVFIFIITFVKNVKISNFF